MPAGQRRAVFPRGWTPPPAFLSLDGPNPKEEPLRDHHRVARFEEQVAALGVLRDHVAVTDGYFSSVPALSNHQDSVLAGEVGKSSGERDGLNQRDLPPERESSRMRDFTGDENAGGIHLANHHRHLGGLEI